MAEKITRWNLHKYPISTQMEYQKARREAAREMVAKNAQIANGFAAISSNKATAEGNLFSRIAMERMKGAKVSKRV